MYSQACTASIAFSPTGREADGGEGGGTGMPGGVRKGAYLLDVPSSRVVL